MDQDFRPMTKSERALVARLLDVSFPGSEEVSEQLRNALVREIDKNGSVDFLVKTAVKAKVTRSVPVEAEGEDLDGTTVHVLLHVIEGTARGLEVYKDDSSHVIKLPEPSEMRLFSPP